MILLTSENSPRALAKSACGKSHTRSLDALNPKFCGRWKFRYVSPQFYSESSQCSHHHTTKASENDRRCLLYLCCARLRVRMCFKRRLFLSPWCFRLKSRRAFEKLLLSLARRAAASWAGLFDYYQRCRFNGDIVSQRVKVKVTNAARLCRVFECARGGFGERARVQFKELCLEPLLYFLFSRGGAHRVRYHTLGLRIYIVPGLRGEQESEISNSLPAIMKERGTMKEPRGLKLSFSLFTQTRKV